ncbi:MAG: hypothetical protein ACXADY_09995 [Candidatus Hodarchaeales archaeon]|jgi:hypothetical protein
MKRSNLIKFSLILFILSTFNLFLPGLQNNNAVLTNLDDLFLAPEDSSQTNFYDSSSYNPKISQVLNITLISPKAGGYVHSSDLVVVSFDPIPSEIQWKWDSTGDWNSTTPNNIINIPIPFGDGTHYIEVRGRKIDDSWDTKTWAFKVDNYRIFIVLVSPKEYSTNNSGTPIIIHFDPTPISVLYSWDDNPLSSLLRDLPVGDGQHTLKVQAEDSDANIYTDEYVFYTDDTPPTLSLNIDNNSIIQSWTPISMSLSSSVDVLNYYWDDLSNISSIYTDHDSHIITTPSNSGEHFLFLEINDTIDNKVTYKYKFTTTIRISLTYPFLYNLNDLFESNVSVFTSTADIKIQPSSLIQCNFSTSPNSTYYNWWDNDTHQGVNTTSPTAAPISGSHKLSIYANDSIGHWHILNLGVEIDGTVPSITNITPENNTAVVRGTDISVATSENLYYLEFIWDDSPLSKNNRTIPHLIGFHTLDISLIDFANNTRFYHYNYYTKFLVTISPSNFTLLNGGTELNITISPTPQSSLFAWDSEDNTSSSTPLPSISGIHVLKIFTQDSSNYWYQDFFVFQTILEVNLTSPINGYPTQSNATLSLSYSESPLTILYSWDSGTWSAVFKDIPNDNGNHSFRVWVENSDLPNTQWFLYEFIIFVDNSPPAITQVNFVNYSRITDNSEIIFIFNETHVDSKYRWNTSLVWSNTTTLPIDATDGFYQLTVKLTDRAGNTIYFYYIYELDLTGITIQLRSPVNGSSIISYDANFNITFSENPATYLFWCSWTDENETKIPQVPYFSTTITIITHCSDGLNWNHSTFLFDIIHYIGKLDSVTPLNGSFITPSHEITFTWSHDPKNVKWLWNNGENQSGSCTSPNNDGNHSLYLYYNDMDGTWIKYYLLYRIDLTPPSLVNSNPTNGSTVSSNVTNVYLNFSELIYEAVFRWNVDINWSSLLTLNSSPLLSITIPLPTNGYGDLILSLQIEDYSGNIAYIDFFIHRLKPSPDYGLLPLIGLVITAGSIGVVAVVAGKYILNKRTIGS